MSKKTTKNAFFYYMLDYKRKAESSGQRISGGMAEVSRLASSTWNTMSSSERAPFEKKAKWAKTQAADSARPEGERLTCHGIPYSLIESSKRAAEKAEETMVGEIGKTVEDSALQNTIATQPYHFIAVNYFCQTAPNSTSDKSQFTPAELGLIRYTLNDGYTRKYHTFINPGRVPLGYANDALDRCAKVHGIPPPPNARGERNLAAVLRDVIAFLHSDRAADGGLPPLYADEAHLPAVRSVLAQLCDASADALDEQQFRVYRLSALFYALKREAARYGLDAEGFQSEHMAQDMLNRDQYDQREEIACAFHIEIDRARNCSLSLATRYAFTISDHICLDLGVDLKPGQHIPADSDVAAALHSKTVLDASRATQQSSRFLDYHDTTGAIKSELDDEDREDRNAGFTRVENRRHRRRRGEMNAGGGGGDGGYSGSDSDVDNTKYSDAESERSGGGSSSRRRDVKPDNRCNYTQYPETSLMDNSSVSGFAHGDANNAAKRSCTVKREEDKPDNLWSQRNHAKPRAPLDETLRNAEEAATKQRYFGLGRGRLSRDTKY